MLQFRGRVERALDDIDARTAISGLSRWWCSIGVCICHFDVWLLSATCPNAYLTSYFIVNLFLGSICFWRTKLDWSEWFCWISLKFKTRWWSLIWAHCILIGNLNYCATLFTSFYLWLSTLNWLELQFFRCLQRLLGLQLLSFLTRKQAHKVNDLALSSLNNHLGSSNGSNMT